MVDGRYEEGLESLRGVDRAGLDPSDRALLDAALSTAGQIRGGAPPAPPVADAARARRPAPDSRGRVDRPGAGSARQVDRMIDRTDP